MTIPHVPRLIAIGPGGLGYCAEVSRIPPRNDGVFAERTITIPVWDCLVVALASRKVAEVTLITNHLGQTADSEYIRRQFAGNHRLVEVGQRRHSCPHDFIMIEKSIGSRRWISSHYGPQPDAVLTALQTDADHGHSGERRFMYVEAAYPPLGSNEFISNIAEHTREPDISLINFGDTPTWEEIETRRPWSACAPNSVLQWSLLGPLTKADTLAMRSRPLARDLADARASLIITRGGKHGAFINKHGLIEIPVKDVKNAFTAGAGGQLSSSLVGGLIDTEGAGIARLVELAFRSSTQYVEDMTASADDYDLLC